MRMSPRGCPRRSWQVPSAVPLQQQPVSSHEEAVISARKAREQAAFVEAHNIAGVSFDGRQELLRQLQPNQILLVEREPWNEYDKNAVRVLDLLGRTLGYIPRKDGANERFKYEGAFALMASVGPVKEKTQLGARIYARSRVPSLLLDPLPAAEAARFTDLPVLFGERWPAAQATFLAASNFRCALTGISKDQMPLRFVPQWRYNSHSKAVQLVGVMVMCEPLAAVKASLEQRLAEVAERSPEEAADTLKELAASPEGRLFVEVNGLDEEDAVQYFELVRRRGREVVEQRWRLEALLV